MAASYMSDIFTPNRIAYLCKGGILAIFSFQRH